MESSSAKLLVSLLLYSVLSSLSRQKNRPPVSEVLSMTFYTPMSADGISFEAQGNAVIDVEKYDLT